MWFYKCRWGGVNPDGQDEPSNTDILDSGHGSVAGLLGLWKDPVTSMV